jgi:hypothetical protein
MITGNSHIGAYGRSLFFINQSTCTLFFALFTLAAGWIRMNMKMMAKGSLYGNSVGVQERVIMQAESTNNISQVTDFIIRLLITITRLFATNTVTHKVCNCQ